MNLARLYEPFPPDRISFRIGNISKKDPSKATVLFYIDARDVMDRLDEVFGPFGWERVHPAADKTSLCGIRIKATDGAWVEKWDGAGASDIEAEKGALSDSFKRAGVNWGIGRYLYDLPTPQASVEGKYLARGEDDRLREWYRKQVWEPHLKKGGKDAKREPTEKEKALAFLEGMQITLNQCTKLETLKSVWAANKDAIAEAGMWCHDEAYELLAFYKQRGSQMKKEFDATAPAA